MQDDGNISSDDPVSFFERSIRRTEESVKPGLKLQIDGLLGFSAEDKSRLLKALTESYGDDHWALRPANFRYSLEIAFQLLAAGLSRLATKDERGPDYTECCSRVVNAPTLSPKIRKRQHNYIIVPTGFISSLENFIASTYAMAAIGASLKDPDRKTALWNRDMLLSSIASLAAEKPSAFTEGVMEASSESAMQQLLDNFSDPLAFMAFDRDMQVELQQVTSLSNVWKTLGYKRLREAFDRYPDVKQCAEKIARLAVCFAICHEFGHSFAFAFEAEEEKELRRDEMFADSMGALFMYKLTESGVIPAIIGKQVTQRDLGDALMSFNAWNLSNQLAGLLGDVKASEIEGALARIHEVAQRWEKTVRLVRRVWIDPIPFLSDENETVTVGSGMTTQWGIVIAGVLRVVLAVKKHPGDMETVCKILPLLLNRSSKIYTYLAS